MHFRYEQQKRLLQEKNLTPEQYEKEIKKLVKELESEVEDVARKQSFKSS